MARYRKIDTRTWNDRKFNLLSDDGKLEFFLLLTHPHLLPIGAMRGTLIGLASEIHWTIARFQKGFQEILNQNMVKYDEQAAFIWLPNFIKYNLPASPNVVRSWDDYLDYLPECPLKDELIAAVAAVINQLSDSFREALPIAFAKTLPNQEQEQDQEQKQDQDQDQKYTHNAREKNSLLIKTNNSSDEVNDSQYHSQAIEILNFLNEKADKAFQSNSYNLKFIINCLKSGASIEDCRRVIVRKCRKWKGDEKRSDWLRPMTIFGERFHQYLGELVINHTDHKEINK